MRKLIPALALLAITLFVALIIVILTFRPSPSRPQDAVSIALADPGIQASIQDHHGIVSPAVVAPLGADGKSGYFDLDDTLVQVTFKVGDHTGGDRNVVYVDLNHSAVLGREWYSYHGIPASIDVTIPEGAGWYHLLSGPMVYGRMVNGTYEATNGTEEISYHLVGLDPRGTEVFPYMVNETNLYRLMNNTHCEAATYIDAFTRDLMMINGSTPLYLNWWLNVTIERPLINSPVTWPAFDYSQHYYLVLINRGETYVNVNLSQEFVLSSTE